jgi:rRNA maturation protein Nop10
MMDRLNIEGTYIHVHAADGTLKTTKSFTHATVSFDLIARTVAFGQLPPVSVPDELELADGIELKLRLVAPDGTLRKQTRVGVLRSNGKAPVILRIPGMAKSPAKFSPSDGWTIEVYKYRCYFSHTGLKTDGEIPEWLKASIARQRNYWNRLSYLCREARRKCSPVPVQEIVCFVHATILPAINVFNDSLAREGSKEKIKHPAKFKVEEPGLDALWRFAGMLRSRIEKNRAVPTDLLEQVVAFSERFKADYAPLNEFMSSLNSIASAEAGALGLRNFEMRPAFTAFKSALDRRRTLKSSWSDGWPAIRFPDSRKAGDWGLHFYFHKAGVGSELLESGRGVPGLTFGSPVKPADSGHEDLRCSRRSARSLREAEISIPSGNKEHCTFRFGVLQHRPLPPGSHLKQWSLVYSDGALWLCLTVERQRPLPVLGSLAAGLDIG